MTIFNDFSQVWSIELSSNMLDSIGKMCVNSNRLILPVDCTNWSVMIRKISVVKDDDNVDDGEQVSFWAA